MKPRIDGLRVVAFTPKPQPMVVETPPAVSDEARKRARLEINTFMQLNRLFEVDVESALIVRGVIDRLLAAHTKPKRKVAKNIGKPVIDLTGDDREGA